MLMFVEKKGEERREKIQHKVHKVHKGKNVEIRIRD